MRPVMVCRRITGLVLLAGILLAIRVVAQDALPPREFVAEQLKVVTDVRADDRFAPDQGALGRSTLLGVLENDATVHIELTLDAGREYVIAARCDTGCANIDTRVLNSDYSLLAEDTLDNDAPQMEVKPAASGPHLLAVRMTSCAANICYFGVVVLSRPARR